MIIEKTSFLVALGGLFAGGAGGYLAGERGLLRPPPVVGVTEQQPPVVTTVALASSAVAPPAPPMPACDDTAGAPGTCPAPGYPSDEGVASCGAPATKRCEDFKRTMKPRVAERAVACLSALSAAQRCDPNRVSLCAHLALMNACPEPEGALVAGVAPTDELTTRCASIAQECGGTTSGPPLRDCRATLAGLSLFGREQMTSCMKTHCADKGLVGCEAVVDAK